MSGTKSSSTGSADEGRIAILSDAHLLIQAYWVREPWEKTVEGQEALENFRRAAEKVGRNRLSAILLAGDMFDQETRSGVKISHREASKYMVEIREILSEMASSCGCCIYALKGNHDSKPVLKDLDEALGDMFLFLDDEVKDISGMRVHFMSSRYQPGAYDISEIPKGADLLLMHETVPVMGPGLNEETVGELCDEFSLVLNGHMHFFNERTLQIRNLCCLPALIPSRVIKGNWAVKYEWSSDSNQLKVEKRDTPFGYVLLNSLGVTFQPCEPLQIVVRAEIRGGGVQEYLKGVETVYHALMERPDRNRVRVWVATNADRITARRVLWPQINTYRDIRTVDILPLEAEPIVQPLGEREIVDLGDKAFNRNELMERVLASLSGKRKRIAGETFAQVFTRERLRIRTHNYLDEFMEVVDLAKTALGVAVSDRFRERVRTMSRGN